MLHTAFKRGAAASVAASTRSEPVGSTPSLSAMRRRNSSALHGASSFWLSSTSKRSRSFATTSSKVARVTRILGFTSSPERYFCGGPAAPAAKRNIKRISGKRKGRLEAAPVNGERARDSAAIDQLRQPEADSREQVQQ